MYGIKPLLSKKEMTVELPTIMYKMENIYKKFAGKVNVDEHQNDIIQRINQISKMDKNSQVEALECRQRHIIEQLQEIKTRLLAMQKNLNVTKPSVQLNAAQLKALNNYHQVVLNVNPKNIPYSLLALQSVWGNRLNFQIQFFIHSTISRLTEANQHFVQQFNKISPNPSLPTFTLTLIWKDVQATELICAPTTFIPICGEINALRYFARVGPTEFNYHSGAESVDILQTEALLDTCHQLISLKNPKDRQVLFHQLEAAVKNRVSLKNAIGEIALFSTLKQLRNADIDSIPELKHLFKQINTKYSC